MNPYPRFCFGVALALMLSACGDNKNYAYYAKNPQATVIAAERCHNSLDGGCADIQRAAKEHQQLYLQASSNPEAFGSTIMLIERRVAANRETLTSLQHNKLHNRHQVEELQRQVDADVLKIKQMLAIVSQLETVGQIQ